MLFIFLIIILLILLILFDWCVLKNEKNFKVPGPKPLPFIGSGHLFNGDSSDFINTVSRMIEQYGSLVGGYFLSIRFLLISEPKHVKAVLSSTNYLTKGDGYRFLHPWLGQGLLTATGGRWKTHRKFLTGAFHFNILKTFLPIFYKNDVVFIQKLAARADGTPFDIFPLVALLTLDNISESSMGVSVNAQRDNQSEYVEAVNDISEVVHKRMLHPLLRFDALFRLSSSKRRQDKALEVLHGHTQRIVDSRRRALDLATRNTTVNNNESDIGIKKKNTFLDMLLLSEVDGKRLDNETVREEVDTFMLGGHDTVTSGICFRLYCLSKHPDVQEKILQEQHEIFGNESHRDPTYNELGDMKYLEMVVRESLRLYPSLPFISRRTTEDTNLAGLEVPKDTDIIFSILHIQRSPARFEDPLSFKPERFEPSLKDNQNAFNWLAFSAGPRNCIGQKFAMMELKLVVSSVIRKFLLLPSDEEPVLCADLVLRSKHGVKIKLLPRN